MARRFGLSTTVFVLGFAVCAVMLHVMYGAPLPGQTTTNSGVVLAALEKPILDEPRSLTPTEVAARAITPAVVTIDTESKPIAVNNPFSGDPFFRQFFGGQEQPQTARQRGVGSGVIISPDGYILTNNHVVTNAATMKVLLSNGKECDARLIGTDPETDIAVCKIDVAGGNLPYAELGDSKSLVVGQDVIAVGNPLDVGTTVTSGIISALGHRSNGVAAGSHPLAADIIQTDAAINPGNSGGALADLQGHVVGINEAIYSENGGFIGIGFAIPIDTARTIAEELIKTGKVVRPYLGIAYAPLMSVDEQSRQQIGVTVTGDAGAIVKEVAPNSPASDAGIQPYDVILQANRQPVTADPNSLKSVIDKLKVGDRLVLLVNRSGKQIIVPVDVREEPKDFESSMGQMQQQQQQQGGPGFGQGGPDGGQGGPDGSQGGPDDGQGGPGDNNGGF